jgi:hypothetical protein
MVHIQSEVGINQLFIGQSQQGGCHMYTVIVFPGGRRFDALLLSASPERLRVAIRGRSDIVELQLIEGRWMSDSGVCVELGAILNDQSAAAKRVLANARPRVLAAS